MRRAALWTGKAGEGRWKGGGASGDRMDVSQSHSLSVGRSVCTGYERTITARDDGVFSL